MGERDLTTILDKHGIPDKESECILCGRRDKQNKVAIRLVNRALATEQQVVGDVCPRCAGLGPQGAVNLMVQTGERIGRSTGIIIESRDHDQVAEAFRQSASPKFDPEQLASRIAAIPESAWTELKDLAQAELKLQALAQGLDAEQQQQYVEEHLKERIQELPNRPKTRKRS